MSVSAYNPHHNISLFVKNVLVFEEHAGMPETILQFFPDGYPGLLFHITPSGQWVQPQNKQMPNGYLYGQTLAPVALHMAGVYKMIVFQLYPFVLHSFFDVDPATLNNECFDLSNLQSWVGVEQCLSATADTEKQIELIQHFLFDIFLARKKQLDYLIKDALEIILANKAQITVKELSERLHITLRTFERRFVKEVGVSAKDFIQITKFQQSLEQLTSRQYNKLSDIVYSNGFADQSHFIRVFKAFSGKTPTGFLKS